MSVTFSTINKQVLITIIAVMNSRFVKMNRPFTCYFCNKLIENDSEQGHMGVCGHVLEPCTNKCGAYIPRKMKVRHSQECPNGQWKSTPVPQQKNLASILTRIDSLEKHQHRKVSDTNSAENLQLRNELEKIKLQNGAIFEWKRSTEMELEQMKKTLSVVETSKNTLDNVAKETQVLFSQIRELNQKLCRQNEEFLQEQLTNRENFNERRNDLGEFKDFFLQENALIGALWNDQKVQIEDMATAISNVDKMANEQKTKYASLVFDVRTVTQISTEALEKVELLEKSGEDLKKQLAQLQTDVDGIEEKFCANCTITSKPGRFLWKLDNFLEKFERAKNEQVVFKSPVFYTHDFGYKIRLLLYLNGLKKWKGRHLLACIHVLKGDYDLLLKWPCHIEGYVILKDLQLKSDCKDFSKYITAKRLYGGEENDEPQESSNEFIFIPHTVLFKENFLKNDTIFVEVKIDRKTKRLSETNL